MRVFNPFTVAVLTTNQCPAICRHCSLDARPDRTERITYEQFARFMDDVTEVAPLTVVVFTGGEPLLLGDDLPKMISLCKEKGVEVTRIVTNGYWATSYDIAHRKLAALQQAGLDEVNVSVDDYHQEYIPMERVRHVFDAAMALEYTSVVLANSAGPKSRITPEWLLEEFGNPDMAIQKDSCGEEMFYRQELGKTQVLINISQLKRLGRGATELSAEELRSGDDTPENLLDGGCPHALRSVALSPNNHYLACCGAEIEGNPILDYGDLDERPLEEVLDRADNDLISNMIAVHGPYRIKEALERFCPDDLEFQPTYASMCELCFDLVSRAKNRQALYRYQGAWVKQVTQAREMFRERFLKDGRVQVPPSISLRSVRKPDAGEDDS